MDDCLIIGAGVVGLSLAYELAGQGLRVRVLEAGKAGNEASWAGAGILPPALTRSSAPIDQLTTLSNRVHAEWTQQLRSDTGIDNGYLACGGVYVATCESEALELNETVETWRSLGVAVQTLSPEVIADCEPGLRPAAPLRAAYFLPEEKQLRNPRHLKALIAGCALRGVRLEQGAAAESFEVAGGRLTGVRTGIGLFHGQTICLTTGAWTPSLARQIRCELAIKPVRGQIALLQTDGQTVRRVINLGKRYIVPRPDGRVLIGSTEEDVGYDRRTTAGAIEQLLAMATALVPRLAGAQLERCWAGLRPATSDGLPYLGVVPGLENAFVAAGHFRSGLQLSAGTAVVMSRLIRGLDPELNLHAFRLDR